MPKMTESRIMISEVNEGQHTSLKVAEINSVLEASGNLELSTKYLFLVTCGFMKQPVLESQEWLGPCFAGT